MARTLLAEIEISKQSGVAPFKLLGRAPERDWEMWAGSQEQESWPWRSLLPGFVSEVVLRSAATA